MQSAEEGVGVRGGGGGWNWGHTFLKTPLEVLALLL